MTDKARSAGAQPRCRGFSLFELIIAGLVVGLLTTLLLVRLQSYQREAQQVAVQHLVGTLRTALSVKNAQLHVAKKEHELQGIINENPISWLIEAPANYRGEYYSPEGNMLSDDSWYFDRGRKELVYISTTAKSFPKREQILLRFKVKFTDLTFQQGKTPGLPVATKGVVLDQVSEKNVVN